MAAEPTATKLPYPTLPPTTLQRMKGMDVRSVLFNHFQLCFPGQLRSSLRFHLDSCDAMSRPEAEEEEGKREKRSWAIGEEGAFWDFVIRSRTALMSRGKVR